MATKTINLSEEAYTRLRNLKREGESFSDVVNRITGKHALRDLVGILSEEDAAKMRAGARDLEARLRSDVGAPADRSSG